MSAGWVSSEASLAGLQMTVLSLGPLTVIPLCTATPGVSASSYKDTSQVGLGLTLKASGNIITSSKTLSPNIVTLQGVED